MCVSIPSDWRKVEESEFLDFLSFCPDHVRDGYSGAVRYSFRYNHKPFAIVKETGEGRTEGIYVDPSLLQPI